MSNTFKVAAAVVACAMVTSPAMAASKVSGVKTTVTVEGSSIKADGFAVSLSIQPIRLGVSRSGEVTIGEIYACNDAQIADSSTTVLVKNSSIKSGGRVGIGNIVAGC